ncbi:MAG: VOC family protein [Leptolyngbya sp. SIO4C1]|nr:VOC family protein [Leptolyngbya sp. SIO4C1]
MSISLKQAFVTLASADFDRLVEFYQTLLNQPPQPSMANRYAEFQLPGLRLGIFKPEDASEFAAIKGRMSLCLEVTNLENAIALLTQLGYPPPGTVIQASHGQEIYAYDPDGNRLILHQSSS